MDKTIYIVFGVSGSGKTTIGKALAAELEIPFYDADDFHSEANRQKMARGMPLTDVDREPWLEHISLEIKKWHREEGAVLACSALKEKYRQLLQSIDKTYIQWIFLEGNSDLIGSRLQKRKNHFFDPSLLTSQFEVLEKPNYGIRVTIDQSVTTIVTKIKSALNTEKTELGVIGLGVMGKSISKNLLSKNVKLSVYNRHVQRKEEGIAAQFVQEQTAATNIVMGFDSLHPFVISIEQPRTILLMIKAGDGVDQMIDALLPLLDAGDCIIDGGNSHYESSAQRTERLKKSGIHFMGVGISGGEEGALKGPSIMPGGTKEGYAISGRFLEAIAARDKNGNPCCSLVGHGGAGHFVKMVHNGIEYAEMQLLAEIYHLFRFYYHQTPDQIADMFASWRTKGKDGFLLEITAEILRKKEGNAYLIDKILDKAAQKGTGGWSTIASLELGKPLSTISEAVMARSLSEMKSERIQASEHYNFKKESSGSEISKCMQEACHAYLAASIINHSVGFDLIAEASKTFDWKLNLSEIARIWTSGCIIRSELMEMISDLYGKHPNTSLLLFPEVVELVQSKFPHLQQLVSKAMIAGCTMPVSSGALNYMLGYTSAQSSANIVQAQRDYFGAHTYQRIDKPSTEYFHTNWKSE